MFGTLEKNNKCKSTFSENMLRKELYGHYIDTKYFCLSQLVWLTGILYNLKNILPYQLSSSLVHKKNIFQEPVLYNLYWILTVTNSSMIDCVPSKECLSEDITSLNKLWPWCMMTEPLRDAIMHLLLTFTNDCPKGNVY